MSIKLKRFLKIGQSTLEYAALVAIVVGGLIAMQAYLKRGVQGKLKATGDQLGEQYSPYSVKAGGYYNTTENSRTEVNREKGSDTLFGKTTTKSNANADTKLASNIDELSKESWFE